MMDDSVRKALDLLQDLLREVARQVQDVRHYDPDWHAAEIAPRMHELDGLLEPPVQRAVRKVLRDPARSKKAMAARGETLGSPRR